MITGRILLALALLPALGCSQLMRGLRPDLDDGYVAEREPIRGGLLADYPEYAAQGRGPRRGVASERDGPNWVSRMGPEQGQGEMRTRAATPAAESGQEEDLAVPETQQPRRITRDDFVDGAEDSGSLWSTNGQTNFFFSKNKTRSAGDLLNITIEGDLLRDLAAEVKRTLSAEERQNELALLAAAPRAASGGGKGAAKSGPDAKGDSKSDTIKQSAAAPDEEGRFSMAQVDLSEAIGVKAGDQFLVEVVERFSNGNYKIRGTKRLSYRGTTKLMTLIGVVRGADLSDDDKVNSGKLYEYRLEVVR